MQISKEQYDQLPDHLKKHFVKGNIHPTVKNIRLMNFLVTMGCRGGDVVLDPFIGSGTTALACEMLNRKWIGIEISKEYCEIARKRLAPWLNPLIQSMRKEEP